MKKLTTAFLLLYLLLATDSFSQGFTSVYSNDVVNVIAVGGNTIYRSVDGGVTWGSFQVSGRMFYSVCAFGSDIWISDQNTNGIYLSTDNGVTWSDHTVEGTASIYGIYFIDANKGWAAGTNGIFKTTDGGLNWATGLRNFRDTYVSVKFTNAFNGVACSVTGGLIYTTNGGSSWGPSTNPAPGKELHSVDIRNNSAIATGADGFILKSTNSGMSWSFMDYNILTRSDVRGVSIINDNTFYSCGGGGFIRKTTDGGNSYAFQENPMMADLYSIYFYDTSRGWAVSSMNNAVLRTSNGGLNWFLPQNTTVTFSWVQGVSAGGNIGNTLYAHPRIKNAMFVVCGSGIYRSPDLAATWTQIGNISISGSAHSFYVNPNDTNQLIASISSSSGRVVKSTDYGATWTTVWGPGVLTPYGMPLEMDPNHPDTLYLSPSNSVLLRSTDFGSTWSNRSVTTFSDMCDILVMYKNSSVIYLSDQVGGGKFYKSTDYGVNWNMLFSPGGAEIPMIGANNLDTNTIYFTNWGGNGFWKTSNGGANWTVVNPLSNAWGADVAKDDPTVAAHGTYGGPVYVTTNSGKDFTTTSPPESINYGVYFYDRGHLLVQDEGGVYRLVITYDVPLAVSQISNQAPKKFYLSQNYPNPFNPVTLIKYDVPKQSNVKLEIFDVLGRLVETPVDQIMSSGQYEYKFNASNLASGIYYYRIESADFTDVKKMILVK